MTFNAVMMLIFFVYGMVFLHFALAISLIQKKRRIHVQGIALLLDYGLMCVGIAAWVYRGFYGIVVNFAALTPMVALAPIGSSLILECFGEYDSRRRFRLLILAGTIAVWIAVAAIILLLPPTELVYILVFGWLAIVVVGVAVHEGYVLRPIWKAPRGLFMFWCVVAADAALVTLSFASLILGLYVVADLLCFVLIISILVVLFHAFKSPETYRIIGLDVEKIRQSRPGLDPALSASACERLDSVMREALLFRDPDLSLDDVAKELSLRPNQLSAIVNAKLGMNFAAVVNRYRVEYAKARLLAEPDSSVLDIGFDSGFNSKSVFNDAFRRATGLTPSEYRKSETLRVSAAAPS